VEGVGFAVIDGVGVLFSLIFLLIAIALLGWFGYAVGSAVGQFGAEKESENDGGFWGMLIGLAVGVYFIFFA
jgi:hypothetical protein